MHKLKLIVFTGLPGSGKSTIAEAIAAQLHFPVFSVDPIESSIIKSGIVKSWETGLAAYLISRDLAYEQLKLGLSVIIDAVNPVKEARDMWYELEKKQHAQLIIIACMLDERIHKKRIDHRVRNIHGIPEVTWEQVKNREYAPWEDKKLIL